MLIGLLTFILVLDCLVLILLVLMQLPKKEAGMGTAFGGGATDALFGAGTGNALTKMTKYTAGIFLGLALILSMLNSSRRNESTANIKKLLQKSGPAPAVSLPPAKTEQKSLPAAVPTAPAPQGTLIPPTAPAPTAPAAPTPAAPATPAPEKK
ncbi:MAG: preprotein translocase subunit SecG [Verrucomicrobia bacterium]|nr:preprotein translocase subunit SecG [Verrucomicrobiota bacterium]